eukprot:UN00539
MTQLHRMLPKYLKLYTLAPSSVSLSTVLLILASPLSLLQPIFLHSAFKLFLTSGVSLLIRKSKQNSITRRILRV